MAELAARLKSAVCYDRAGQVVSLWDFQHGLQGTTFGVDAAPSAGSLVSSRSVSGYFSIKLDPSDAEGSYVEWRGQAYYVPAGKMGLEVSISPDTDFDYIRMILWPYSGANILQATIRYYAEEEEWRVKDADAGYVVVLSDYKLQQGAAAWHPFKMVIDTDTKAYVRMSIDDQVIDLSAYTILEVADPGLAQLAFGVTTYGEPDNHAPCYFDRFIITQNEP
jgi:hypothetical protein